MPEMPKPNAPQLLPILGGDGPRRVPDGQTEKDPVCGMNVDSHTAAGRHEHAGRSYYFCNPRCLEKFRAEPDRYVTPEARTEETTTQEMAAPKIEALKIILKVQDLKMSHTNKDNIHIAAAVLGEDVRQLKAKYKDLEESKVDVVAIAKAKNKR